MFKKNIDFLKKHPVYKKIMSQPFSKSKFVKAQEKSLLNLLKKENTNLYDQYTKLNSSRQKFMFTLEHTNNLHSNIVAIEKKLTSSQKKEIVDAGIETIAMILGMPKSFINDVFEKIDWHSKSIDNINLKKISKPIRLVELDQLNPQRKKILLNLISKRLTHNLIIQGHSIDFFYRTIDLFSDKIDSISHGLSKLYKTFSVMGELNQIAVDEIPSGMDIRPDMSNVNLNILKNKFNERIFKANVSAINFPSLYQEIIKGVYEALMHEGMPTKEKLGESEKIFHNVTSNDYMEFIEFKYGPETSKKFHSFLDSFVSKFGETLKSEFYIKGYDKNYLNNNFIKTLLYKEFSKLSPRKTAYFMSRLLDNKINNKIYSYFLNEIKRS